MILVDSSVWIDYFNRRSLLAERMDALLGTREALATTGIIEQEVLQGLKSEAAVRDIERIFDAMMFFPADDRQLHRRAAATHRELRRRGVTIRSSIDVLIAELCLRHQLPVWHLDRDFDQIAGLRPLHLYQPAADTP